MKTIGDIEEIDGDRQPVGLWVSCASCSTPDLSVNGVLRDEPLFREKFIFHRNVANLVVPTDINCLAALEFAIEVCGVEKIIVGGHYNCRGVKIGNDDCRLGFLGNWLKPIGITRCRYENLLSEIADPNRRIDALCELNVIEQVVSACRTSVVGAAWRSGRVLTVGGLIYNEQTGSLADLNISVGGESELLINYETAISSFKQRWRL